MTTVWTILALVNLLVLIGVVVLAIQVSENAAEIESLEETLIDLETDIAKATRTGALR